MDRWRPLLGLPLDFILWEFRAVGDGIGQSCFCGSPSYLRGVYRILVCEQELGDEGISGSLRLLIAHLHVLVEPLQPSANKMISLLWTPGRAQDDFHFDC